MNTTLQAAAKSALPISLDWQSFADRLSAVLATLEVEQYLILAIEHPQRFIQFAGFGASGLRTEAVGNAYLAAEEGLTADQVAALLAAGWKSPTHKPEADAAQRGSTGSPNFFVDFEAPVLFATVAELAIRALAEVFEVSRPDQLEYNAFDAKGSQLQFPDLNCRRVQRRGPTTDAKDSFGQDLLAVIRECTGINDLELDSDGDICLYWRGQALFVCRLGSTPFVRIWSAVLRDVEETPELIAQVNLLNASAGVVRFVARNGFVLAETEFAADPVVAPLVGYTLRRFCAAIDDVDTLLQHEFGGDTSRCQHALRTPLH